MNTTLAPGHLENEVLVGHDGMLFLGGGAHHVMDYVTGTREMDERGITTFRANLLGREAWARRQEAGYVHVITPDKQSIVPGLWPIADRPMVKLGEVVKHSLGPQGRSLHYPVDLLAAQAAAALPRVDTHYTDHGAILVAADIAERLLGAGQEATRAPLLAALTGRRRHSGDLGSKLSPQVFGQEASFEGTLPGRLVSNNMTLANNGIMDIWLNPAAPHGLRLAFFGDSFGRQICKFLRVWFREIVFLRSPWFHPEMTNLFKPHHVVTQNVERGGSRNSDSLMSGFPA